MKKLSSLFPVAAILALLFFASLNAVANSSSPAPVKTLAAQIGGQQNAQASVERLLLTHFKQGANDEETFYDKCMPRPAVEAHLKHHKDDFSNGPCGDETVTPEATETLEVTETPQPCEESSSDCCEDKSGSSGDDECPPTPKPTNTATEIVPSETPIPATITATIESTLESTATNVATETLEWTATPIPTYEYTTTPTFEGTPTGIPTTFTPISTFTPIPTDTPDPCKINPESCVTVTIPPTDITPTKTPPVTPTDITPTVTITVTVTITPTETVTPPPTETPLPIVEKRDPPVCPKCGSHKDELFDGPDQLIIDWYARGECKVDKGNWCTKIDGQYVFLVSESNFKILVSRSVAQIVAANDVVKAGNSKKGTHYPTIVYHTEPAPNGDTVA